MYRLLSRFTWVIVLVAGLSVVEVAESAVTVSQEEPEVLPYRWLVRVMVWEVIPVRLTSEISTIGGRVETPRKHMPGVDLSYFFTEHWALEFEGGPFERNYRIKGSEMGDFAIGKISTNAFSLTLQYHLYPRAQFSPYLGVGINRAWTREVQSAPGIPEFEVKPISSGILDIGLDYHLNRCWMLSTSLHYLISPEYSFEGQGFNSVVSMNTLVVGAGLGFRF